MTVALTLVAESVRLAAPYAALAIAGAWSERAGVVQIGLEAVLLTSAFGAAAAALATGSAVVGLGAALVVGMSVSWVHVALVERLRVDPIVSGMALNLAAFAGTRTLLRGLYDSASNSPALAVAATVGSGEVGALARVLLDPLTLAIAFAAVASPWWLANTRFGLQIRAVGEAPPAARAAGVSVWRVRASALLVSGALGALGGAHLVFDQRRFEAGMSAGRGFVALAAVALAGRDPLRAALACVGFGALEALQVQLQDVAGLRGVRALVQALPYVVTLGALVVAARRAKTSSVSTNSEK
jgi:ABC-type uncharacterized transport system permease subunit